MIGRKRLGRRDHDRVLTAVRHLRLAATRLRQAAHGLRELGDHVTAARLAHLADRSSACANEWQKLVAPRVRRRAANAEPAD